MTLTPILAAVGPLIAAGFPGAPLSEPADERGSADPKAANKTSIASSTVEVFGPAEEVTLLSTSIKTASPVDVVIGVTPECDILTEVVTTGSDVAQASAAVRLWIVLDARPVVVNSAEKGEDAGKVTFCDRIHRQTTSNFDDEDATIRQFLKTRTANAFNWIALDLGSGTHDIEVRASLAQEAVPDATAEAAVGKRTLVVEPFHFPVGTTNQTDPGEPAPTRQPGPPPSPSSSAQATNPFLREPTSRATRS